MAKCRQDQRSGRLDPADDLDHEIDVLSSDQRLGVGGEQLRIDAWAVSVVSAHRDADQLQWPAHPGAQICCLFDDQSRHLRANHTAAEQGHAKRCERRNVEERRGTHAGQSHGNLIYTTRPRPRIVAVSLFTIDSVFAKPKFFLNRAGLTPGSPHPRSNASKSSIVSRLSRS